MLCHNGVEFGEVRRRRRKWVCGEDSEQGAGTVLLGAVPGQQWGGK